MERYHKDWTYNFISDVFDSIPTTNRSCIVTHFQRFIGIAAAWENARYFFSSIRSKSTINTKINVVWKLRDRDSSCSTIPLPRYSFAGALTLFLARSDSCHLYVRGNVNEADIIKVEPRLKMQCLPLYSHFH